MIKREIKYDQLKFDEILKRCREFSEKHQMEIGIVEIITGAAIIYGGIQCGALKLGSDLVGISDGAKIGAISGGVVGSSLGILGSIGIAAGGGAIGVPAVVVARGGLLIGTLFGYTIGDIWERSIFSGGLMEEIIKGGSVLGLGMALLIDGAHRIYKDPKLKKVFSYVKKGIVFMKEVTGEIIVKSKDDALRYLRILKKSETIPVAASLSIGGLLGATVGGNLAAGMVTVMGSSTLGSLALSLSLVSMPVWPIFAVGGSVAGATYGVIKWGKYLKNKKVFEKLRNTSSYN